MKDGVDRLAQTLKALADSTRLQILALLSRHGELCVCDVEHALDISQSSASRQLAHLVRAGLVKCRRRGTWMHCAISDQLVGEQAAILEALLSSESFELMEPAIEERLRDWLNGCCREDGASRRDCGC